VEDHSTGEKNGKIIGKTLNIVAKNAEETSKYHLVQKRFKNKG